VRNSRRDLIEEAIRASGRHDLWTTDEPGKIHYNCSDDGYFGLWLSDGEADCSDFWEAVRRLEQEPMWSMFLRLTEDR
jgi:hypothetical protein